MMRRILEITTRIGCSNICEYCPQAKLIKNYTENRHGHRIEKRFTEDGDIKVLQKMLVHDYLNKDKNRETEMTLDTFKKCLSTVPSSVDIHFTGYTEPFENESCIDMISHVLEKGHRVSINTTIVGMTKDTVDKLEALYIEYPAEQDKELNFHLPSDVFYEKIGRTRIKEKRETGNEISEEYMEMLDYILKSRLPIRKNTYHFHAHGGIHREILERFKDRLPVKNRGINSRAGNLGKLTGEALWENNWCERIFHNVLLPDGGVQLCCQDYGLDEPLGNLKDMEYEEIHNTNKFYKISQGGAKLCQACDDGVAVPKDGKVKLTSMQNYQEEWRDERRVKK